MSPQLNQENPCSLSEDQFSRIVAAILDGKYSWACLLMLSFAGRNPLQYIPYRTYNRLMKENEVSELNGIGQRAHEPYLKVNNLPHQATLEKTASRVRGGNGAYDVWHHYFDLPI